jgi:NADH-quinone oxidoreductase subunit N
MNASLMSLEIAVVLLGLGFLLLDLWIAPEHKRKLGYVAAFAVLVVFAFSFRFDFEFFKTPTERWHLVSFDPKFAFNNSYVMDGLALFFKRFFLLAAVLVLIMAAEFADRIESGISEYYSLILFALAGMMFASSANDFTLLFVSLELITVTFYVLTSFQRSKVHSLEAGVKYLVIGGLSTGFTVFGIALVYGTVRPLMADQPFNPMNFADIAQYVKYVGEHNSTPPILVAGLLLILAGLGFKIAAVPFQIWAPDVYQGSPAPTTAFLAVGSKAAGIVLLLRVLFTAVPDITQHWEKFLIALSALTILYGNLCAIPQRSIKRLLGYSSIAHAGYLLLGVAACARGLTRDGATAILYYLGGYLFTVLAAFSVITVVLRQVEGDDVSALAGLNKRSPFLATAMTVAMVSLAGIPPLAGFFGKFLLLKAVIEQGPSLHAYYWLAGVAIIGVVVSLYYYFGVVRAIYWSENVADVSTIRVPLPTKLALSICIAGILFLGIYPQPLLTLANGATQSLNALSGPAGNVVAQR